jgi:hypothetical protein
MSSMKICFTFLSSWKTFPLFSSVRYENTDDISHLSSHIRIYRLWKHFLHFSFLSLWKHFAYFHKNIANIFLSVSPVETFSHSQPAMKILLTYFHCWLWKQFSFIGFIETSVTALICRLFGFLETFLTDSICRLW